MYEPRETSVNNTDSDTESIYEDEDETTRILPPEGNVLNIIDLYIKYLQFTFQLKTQRNV